jgi:hypothetical protein
MASSVTLSRSLALVWLMLPAAEYSSMESASIALAMVMSALASSLSSLPSARPRLKAEPL